MKNEVARARAELAKMERGRGRRFSPKMRGMIVEAVGVQRKRGESWLSIGRALGLPPETPRRLWMAAGASDGPGGFLRVTVSDDEVAHAGACGVVLVSPSGFRVEGLDAGQIADLLLRLR